MAEWLGTGLQNPLQRFESASDLKPKGSHEVRSFFVSKDHVKQFLLLVSGLREQKTIFALAKIWACRLPPRPDHAIIRFYL